MKIQINNPIISKTSPFILGIVIFLMMGSSVHSATLSVPSQYNTIQAAINAAAPNDTVRVAPGTYNENISINKTITVQAEQYDMANPQNNKTIILGNSNNYVVNMSGNNPSIIGFVIKGGTDGLTASNIFTAKYNHFTQNDKDLIGCEPGCGGTIANNVFTQSGDDSIDVDGLVKNMIIENNKLILSGQDGIEIRLFDDTLATPSELTIRNNIIERSDEDGIQLIDYSKATNRIITMERNLFLSNGFAGIGFMNNKETYEDYRAAAINEKIRIFNNTFHGNNHGISGSGALNGTGDGTIIVNNIFTNNQVGYKYSAAANASNTVVANSLFFNNGTNYTPSALIRENTIIKSDPKYVDATANNFSLQSTSPALNIGAKTFSFNNASFSFTHLGAAPDLGYVEYGGVVPTSAVTPTPTSSVGTAPTSTPSPRPSNTTRKLGDANSDNIVDDADYDIWFEYYGVDTINGANDGDFNTNGKVDGVDYAIWLSQYGSGLTPTLTVSSVPTATKTPSPIATNIPTQQPSAGLRAFPNAQGFGANSVGGRGGKVYEVTNLNDSGAGSLRECAQASGPRVCVFRTGGTIELASRLEIINPYLTIAGQTASGDGITLKSNPNNNKGLVTIRPSAHDVIIRYIRIRPGLANGSGQTLDALTVDSSNNIVIDHVSMSWGVDENVNTWEAAHHVSLQWNIISESLDCTGTHPDGCHSKGALMGSADSHSFTFHHNLLAHNQDRHPEIKPRTAGVVDVINNVVYNYGKRNGLISDRYGIPYVNYIGNYIKAGPNSASVYEITYYNAENRGTKLYVEGNIGPHRQSLTQPESNVVDPNARNFLVTTPFASESVTKTSAQDAYNSVLAESGANKRLACDGSIVNMRDSVDTRIVNDVRNGTGRIIDNQSQVGGWPTLSAGTPCVDTDHDGMPNVWEQRMGFNINVNDGIQDADKDDYTNLEEYLNLL